MFGTFQQSNLRLEVEASAATLQKSLTDPAALKQWLWFERFPTNLPDSLQTGATFTGWIGFTHFADGFGLPVHYKIDVLETDRVRFLLSQSIDGYHEWAWGDGWVQSRLAGISLLPLNLGQTVSLLSLKQFLKNA